ncbi:MAG: hypothetical protein R2829_12900 [Bacteroidia bacterium]
MISVRSSDTMLMHDLSLKCWVVIWKKYLYLLPIPFLTPVDMGSYSSRVTFMAGNAAKMVLKILKKKLESIEEKKASLPMKYVLLIVILQ